MYNIHFVLFIMSFIMDNSSISYSLQNVVILTRSILYLCNDYERKHGFPLFLKDRYKMQMHPCTAGNRHKQEQLVLQRNSWG
jgi:hypothetical protein